MRTGRENWGSSAQKREGFRDILEDLSILKEGIEKKRESDFLHRHVWIGQG